MYSYEERIQGERTLMEELGETLRRMNLERQQLEEEVPFTPRVLIPPPPRDVVG